VKPEDKDLPILGDAVARWDADARKVRYYATWDDTDAWVEICAEEFANVTRANVQDAVVAIGHHVDETLTHVRETLADFMAFRKTMEKMFEGQHPPSRDEGKGN